MTNEEYQKKFNSILEEMKAISFPKHSDYGNDSVFRYGMKMRFADIWRKFARLDSLIWQENCPEDKKETIRDTLLDLANYSAIALIVYDEENDSRSK